MPAAAATAVAVKDVEREDSFEEGGPYQPPGTLSWG